MIDINKRKIELGWIEDIVKVYWLVMMDIQTKIKTMIIFIVLQVVKIVSLNLQQQSFMELKQSNII